MVPSVRRPTQSENSRDSGGRSFRRDKFAKRKFTLKKKAVELSTLCNATVCSIVLDPDGSLETWPENPDTVKSILTQYRSFPRKPNRSKISPNTSNNESSLSEDNLISSLPENSLVRLWTVLELKLAVLREKMNVLKMNREKQVHNNREVMHVQNEFWPIDNGRDLAAYICHLLTDGDAKNQASGFQELPQHSLPSVVSCSSILAFNNQTWSMDQDELRNDGIPASVNQNNKFQSASFHNFLENEISKDSIFLDESWACDNNIDGLIFPLQKESLAGSIWPNSAATIAGSYAGSSNMEFWSQSRTSIVPRNLIRTVT